MSKIIAICGSTGQQSGAVAQACLKAGGWHVRGSTRNSESRSAQALASQGAEMVVADIDDQESLVKAFEGAYAVFCVTNFWEHLGLGADAAGEREAGQAMNVALAASKISTLEHYLFSTLPEASAISGGKRPVPHMDHKARVDDRIRSELPDLAKKTTFCWLGWYSANMAGMALIRPFKIPSTGGKWVWAQPSKPDALLPISGDVTINLGVFAVAALNHPDKTRGKYINVKSDVLSFEKITEVWSEATGKDCVYVPIAFDTFATLWGPAGVEMAMQYAFGEDNDDWEVLKREETCQPEDIGIKKDQLVDLRGNLEGLKAKLLG